MESKRENTVCGGGKLEFLEVSFFFMLPIKFNNLSHESLPGCILTTFLNVGTSEEKF